jgi:hypothetical protein
MSNAWSAVIATVACFAVLGKASAEPILTISCDKPNGFNIAYGTSLNERFDASQKNQPEPPPALSGPNKDGYLGKPTFVIDSNKKNMTVIWGELPEQVELREQSKRLNLPTLPPPAATHATVVLFLDEQISAIEVVPFSIMTYSFFPTIGTAYIGQQSMQPGSKSTTTLATFARCQYSWANPRSRGQK